jgi:hypothetical protein
MSAPTAESRLRGRIGAYSLHAQHDPKETTKPGRAAFLATFEAQVDPEGVLPLKERQRRAECARKAHFARMALASAKARRRKNGAAE